ncbi:hypothetical protein ACH40E_35955 [Streptomyces acidicola]|uniref:hypothetical protein n=1 Tax=Streptomyces acidicola TaxID=2596892 RepID=UPI0037A007A4
MRLITEYGADDPGETIALAIAGAEAAEGLAAALDGEWALYTPQQAAVTASALFAQISAAGAALRKLDTHLDVLAQRGDIVPPDYNGAGEAKRLCTAQSTLGASGQEAAGAVDARACDAAVRTLDSTPYFGTLPANAHETIIAVAGLLGDSAQLLSDCGVQGEADLAGLDQDGCGCRIQLTSGNGAVWDFHRADSTWYLMPEYGDLRRNGVELSMTEARAHPEHLAMLVGQALETAL